MDRDDGLHNRHRSSHCEKRWIELIIPGAQTGLLLLTLEGQEDGVLTFFNGSFWM